MALDIEFIDQELERRGVDPQKLSFLLPNMRGGRFSLESPEEARRRIESSALTSQATQPDRLSALRRDPSFLTPGLSFVQPRSAIAAPPPNLAQAAQISPLSFLNRQPAPLAVGTNPADPAAKGAPTVSFVKRPHPASGPQDREVQSADAAAAGGTASSPGNAAQMMGAAQRATAGADVTQPRPIEEEYRQLFTEEPTRGQFPAKPLPWWKKLLGAVASTAAGLENPNVAGETARRIFGGPERRAEEQFEHAHSDWERKVGNVMRAANLRHLDVQDRNLQSEIDVRNRPDNPNDKKIDEGFNAQHQRVLTFQRPNGETYTKVFPDIVQRDKTTGHTSPFEAFAYGTPEEKKAAQDFLDLERRLGAKYKNPSEFDERYRLFKEHPDDYRAMFGDKTGGGPDRAAATRMLNYFDRRRREVNGDFTLDDEQKKQQLQEIENLERPFMEAVQPGAGRGGSTDRVEVIHPNGQRGTIPRSQLEAARKKGYREAQPQ